MARVQGREPAAPEKPSQAGKTRWARLPSPSRQRFLTAARRCAAPKHAHKCRNVAVKAAAVRGYLFASRTRPVWDACVQVRRKTGLPAPTGGQFVCALLALAAHPRWHSARSSLCSARCGHSRRRRHMSACARCSASASQHVPTPSRRRPTVVPTAYLKTGTGRASHPSFQVRGWDAPGTWLGSPVPPGQDVFRDDPGTKHRE